MSLLPKSNQEFAEKDYWNAFFQKRGKKAFEWYGEYLELCGQLHKYIKTKDDILVVGCGNSKMSMDLYDVGCRKITNIDISQLVINQMNELNKPVRPDMKYLHMDATNMSFENQTFSVVLDKGTLDALMTDDTNDVRTIALKYFNEVNRVLRSSGRFVCISLLQEHIIKTLVDYFPAHNWMFRVIRCLEAEKKTAESSVDGTAMPVFIIIATKFEKLPFPVLEICMSSGDKMIRLNTTNDILTNVLAVQKAALVCNGLHRGNIVGMNELSMDLFRPNEDCPRFTVHILDQKHQKKKGKFAIFIVPQGRETEWLFSTPEGRKKLCLSAQYDRLAIVSMHRGQIYTTWDNVKDELSDSMKNLAPSGAMDEIPYLSLGSEVGNRETIFKGHSDLSGEYIVEEFTGQDNKIFRRLVFLSNQFVVQSEAFVKVVRNKKNEIIEKKIDLTYLACQHHLYMTLGVNLISQSQGSSKENLEIAVIGLGGGGLCTFIHQYIKNINITAVDIDPAMLSVATDYFGLTQSDRLRVVIDDGIDFLKKSAENGTKFHAILFDVDGKDPALGMSCPPKNFLNIDVLDSVRTCIGTDGIFILNLVCRNESLHDQVLSDLQQSFKSICCYKLDEDVNEILYLKSVQNGDKKRWQTDMEKSAKSLNGLRKKLKLPGDGSKGNLIDVVDFLNDLKIK